jgi:hypothetical protein
MKLLENQQNVSKFISVLIILNFISIFLPIFYYAADDSSNEADELSFFWKRNNEYSPISIQNPLGYHNTGIFDVLISPMTGILLIVTIILILLLIKLINENRSPKCVNLLFITCCLIFGGIFSLFYLWFISGCIGILFNAPVSFLPLWNWKWAKDVWAENGAGVGFGFGIGFWLYQFTIYPIIYLIRRFLKIQKTNVQQGMK